jgi:hypothetical protein
VARIYPAAAMGRLAAMALVATLLAVSQPARGDGALDPACMNKANDAASQCLARPPGATDFAHIGACRRERQSVYDACVAQNQNNGGPGQPKPGSPGAGASPPPPSDAPDGGNAAPGAGSKIGDRAPREGESCGDAGGHIHSGACWVLGITRDDCRTILHGQTRDSGGYQYCVFAVDAAGNAVRGPKTARLQDGEPCGDAGGHVYAGACWVIGITRDDCRNILHGVTRERDSYQYCAYDADVAAHGPKAAGSHPQDGEPCGDAGGHIYAGACWVIGITRDDCRNILHGVTRERDSYQYCAYDADAAKPKPNSH